jgi:hypothetical protein
VLRADETEGSKLEIDDLPDVVRCHLPARRARERSGYFVECSCAIKVLRNPVQQLAELNEPVTPANQPLTLDKPTST